VKPFFYAAEEQRKAQVDPIKFPVYHGPGDKTSVINHINVKVKDWYMKKQASITKGRA